MILLKNICLSKGEEMVITIARTFGSGGKSAAVELAGRLGIPCYENEIMDMAAEASGINRQLFYASSEKARRRSFLQMIKNTPKEILVTSPQDKNFLSDDNLFNYQAQLIRYLALSGSCVIVGKCADYILGDPKNVFRFFVDAPEDVCVREIEEKMAVSHDEAERLVKKTNKYRSDYYRYYTGHAWKDPVNYDMILNSDRIGRNHVADVMEAYIRSRYDFAN